MFYVRTCMGALFEYEFIEQVPGSRQSIASLAQIVVDLGSLLHASRHNTNLQRLSMLKD